MYACIPLVFHTSRYIRLGYICVLLFMPLVFLTLMFVLRPKGFLAHFWPKLMDKQNNFCWANNSFSFLCERVSLQLPEYVMCVTASGSTEIFNHWMPLEITAKVQNYAKRKWRLIRFFEQFIYSYWYLTLNFRLCSIGMEPKPLQNLKNTKNQQN